MVPRHTKYSGIQLVYSKEIPNKRFYNFHRMDLIMIRPPGIQARAFVISPDSVWYPRVLLLFLASANTDTKLKSFCTGLDARNL